MLNLVYRNQHVNEFQNVPKSIWTWTYRMTPKMHTKMKNTFTALELPPQVKIIHTQSTPILHQQILGINKENKIQTE